MPPPSFAPHIESMKNEQNCPEGHSVGAPRVPHRISPGPASGITPESGLMTCPMIDSGSHPPKTISKGNNHLYFELVISVLHSHTPLSVRQMSKSVDRLLSTFDSDAAKH